MRSTSCSGTGQIIRSSRTGGGAVGGGEGFNWKALGGGHPRREGGGEGGRFLFVFLEPSGGRGCFFLKASEKGERPQPRAQEWIRGVNWAAAFKVIDEMHGQRPRAWTLCLKVAFSPTAEKLWGLSPDRLRGGPGRPPGKVPQGFLQGSTGLPGFHEVLRGLRGGASTKKSTACRWGYYLSLV